MSTPSKKRKIDNPIIDMRAILPNIFLNFPPLIEVFVGTIVDFKHISTVILGLNSLLPLPVSLSHLKRVKELDILLVVKDSDKFDSAEKVLEHLSLNRQFEVSLLKSDIKTIMVASEAPKTKRQHCEVNQLWPCNFHPDKHLESLINNTIFNHTELQNHAEFMKIALRVAYLSQSVKKMGAIVVDPKINSVVAIGFKIDSSDPSRHALMSAIDNVALTQNGGAFNKPKSYLITSERDLNGFLNQANLDMLKKEFAGTNFGARKFRTKEKDSPQDLGPYLCTGYYVYATHEPCLMCAMALVHSRVKTVFFGSTTSLGALETIFKLHGVQALNHHFEVFGGLLRDECAKLG